jgi:hypothetical protein
MSTRKREETIGRYVVQEQPGGGGVVFDVTGEIVAARGDFASAKKWAEDRVKAHPNGNEPFVDTDNEPE